MTDYSELDRLIVEAIQKSQFSWLVGGPHLAEARRIARETGRHDFIEHGGRVQALIRAGKIRHQKASPSTGPARWVAVDGESERAE